MSVPVLRCENLSKSYNSRDYVIKNLSVSFSTGKIIGLLGPNGCGKSTLMKMICGLLTPSEGEIYICGEKQSEKSNSLISYLPERTYFSSWMKVEELIKYFCDFYPDFDERLARKMLANLNIDTQSKLRALSKGTKEKVQLVLVMSRRARLYLLDEPIGGVDPAARDYILQTIVGNYNPDATVIITTHLIHDIEPVLDEFAFLTYGGEILLSGDVDEIRTQRGKSIDEIFREEFKCSEDY